MTKPSKAQARQALTKLLEFFGASDQPALRELLEPEEHAGPLALVEPAGMKLADDGGGRWGSLAFYPYERPTRCREVPGVGMAHVGSFRADQCGDCLCGAVRLCGCGRCIQDARGGKASRRPDTPVLDMRRAGAGWTSRE